MSTLEQKLSRIDLNLLVSMNVLLQERSVSKAADVLFITQPAMSKTLQRLRVVFDDPLFFRTAKGLTPTAKGQELERQLPDVLSEIHNLFLNKKFVPAECYDDITISIPTILSFPLLFPLLQEVSTLAPNISITDVPSEANPFDGLESLKYDFAVHVAPRPNDNFEQTSLGKLKTSVFARKSHPLANKKNEIIDLKPYKFVDYQVSGDELKTFENPAQRIDRLIGFSPDIISRSSDMNLIKALLQAEDYLFISPSFFLSAPGFSDDFTQVYSFDISQLHQHELLLLTSKRIASSPVHQWLKSLLIKHMNIE